MDRGDITYPEERKNRVREENHPTERSARLISDNARYVPAGERSGRREEEGENDMCDVPSELTN